MATNYERLTKSSPEELIELFMKMCANGCCPCYEYCNVIYIEECRELIRKWLETEVEDDPRTSRKSNGS